MFKGRHRRTLAVIGLVVTAAGWLPAHGLAAGLAAAFNVSPAAGAKPGQPVAFDGSPSTDAVSWVWDFGDGFQATGERATHRFRSSGEYVTTLVVRDAAGDWSHFLGRVDVLPIFTSKVEEEVRVPSLNASLFGTVTRPNAPGRFPAILEYGPYHAGGVGDGNWDSTLVRSGYAYVKFAMPGKDESTGDFDMFGRATAIGGYDAVEWIARQPWSNGKVGLAGFSGPAVAAMDTLGMRPPHLVTAALRGSFSDFYRDSVHVGGTSNSNTFVNAWNAEFYAEPAASTQTATPWANVPQRDADITGAAADMNARVLYDTWWRERTYAGRRINVPVLYYGTHRDLWPRAAPELLRWLRPEGGKVILIYGGHGPIDPTGYAPSMQTEQAGGYAENALGPTRAWFDHYLKGVDNGVDRRAPLSLLVPRGADWNASLGYRWLGLRDWPDPSTNWLALHLGGAGTDGSLAPNRAGTGADSALGGAAWGASGNSTMDGAQQLVYQTGPLPADLTVAGPAAFRLFASAVGADVDWNVQLEEVLPDGEVRQVQDGQLDAAKRNLDLRDSLCDLSGDVVKPAFTYDRVEPIAPNAVYEYEIEIPTVFDTFTKGSRIRLVVAANDARPTVDAHDTPTTAVSFTINHGGAQDSELVLPEIPDPASIALPLPYTEGGRQSVAPAPHRQATRSCEQ